MLLATDGCGHGCDDQLIEKDDGVEQEQEQVEAQARSGTKSGPEMPNIKRDTGNIEGDYSNRQEWHWQKIGDRCKNETECDGKDDDNQDIALAM